jgi:predicted nucleotidyltransferase
MQLLDSPNSILGIEYTKAILNYNSDIEILPILRIGGGYNDLTAYKNFSSASSIRDALLIRNKKIVKHNVPNFVYKDIDYIVPDAGEFIFYSLLTRTAKELSEILDCTEGLENRIKALMKDSFSLKELTEKIATKRYTKTRINRICLSAFLNIKEELVRKSLKSELYLKVLAIKESRMDLLSEIKNSSKLPLLTRKSDYRLLSGFQTECFEKDIEAGDIYNFVTKQKNNEFIMPIVK